MIDIEKLYKWHEEHKELEKQRQQQELIKQKIDCFIEKLELCRTDIKALKNALNEKTIKEYASDIKHLYEDMYQIVFSDYLCQLPQVPHELIQPVKRYCEIQSYYNNITDGRLTKDQNKELSNLAVTHFKKLQEEYKQKIGYYLDMNFIEEQSASNSYDTKITLVFNLSSELWV
jgi:hypothetical protein